MWFIVGIVGLSMSVPITRIITQHLQTMAKIKGDLIQNEIELEKLKQQNYIIETEKMKLELKKMQLEYQPEKIELSKV
ncbi:hypothetical protein ACFSFY_03890 [Sporosarcina siberiensis]|uniref:Septum formation initiator n=1 Tax=Sporosarcina siberiensis TaxID=1365606 RepID=A0ABW4SCK2_9BACL